MKAAGIRLFLRSPLWRRHIAEARRRAPIILLALGLSFIFLAFRDAVRDLVLDPAFHIFLFLDALPQTLVWLLALGLFVLFSWRFFSWPQASRARGQKKLRQEGTSVAEIAALIRRARFSPWAQRTLRARLARVALALRCDREKLRPREAWDDFTQGYWPRHPRVAAFLRGEDARAFEKGLRETVEALERYIAGGDL